MVAHPVMQALLEIKWKFIRPFFFGHLAIFILFTVLWSIDFAYPSVQEKHVYNFPRDSWRVIMEVINDNGSVKIGWELVDIQVRIKLIVECCFRL